MRQIYNGEMIDDILSHATGFDWDAGNENKNRIKHQVDKLECEQIFFNDPLLMYHDHRHSNENESRYYVLGKTDANRELFIAFTMRDYKIRVISARDMSKKERRIYES